MTTKTGMALAVAEFDLMQHGAGDLDGAEKNLLAIYDNADNEGRAYLFKTALMFFKSNLESVRRIKKES